MAADAPRAAAFYCSMQLGFSLVAIPPGSKGPNKPGWQRAGITSVEGARRYWGSHPREGMGLLHAEAGTATFDQDTDAEHVALALEACGVDYAALMALPGPRIIGNPSKPCKPLYRVPPAFELKTHKLVWPSRSSDPTEVVTVFELRAGRVQDVLPPTIHPDTGKPYVWDPVPRRREDVPFVPQPLLRLWLEWSTFKPLLEAACPWAPEKPVQEPRVPRGEPYTGPSIIDAWNERVHASVVLERNGYEPAGDGRWLAPGSTTGEPGVVTLDDGRLFSHHGSDPLHCDHSHDSFSVLTVLEHGGDQGEAAYSARAELDMLEDGRPEVRVRAPVMDPPEPRTESESAPPQRSRDVEPPDPGKAKEGVPLVLPTLPAEFWGKRDSLKHIRQKAWSVRRSPDAVLHCVLSRIAAFRPTVRRITTGVGRPASSNYLCVLADASGAGKSSPDWVASELVKPEGEHDDRDGLPIGTGEGIAEAFMGVVEEADGEGKPKQVRKQVWFNAHFYVDEGEELVRLMRERKGATLGGSMRRSFDGATLGQANASRDSKRIVKRYALGMVVASQPEFALAILEDYGAGTPQRFFWAGVVDPNMPDVKPADPDKLPLDWLKVDKDFKVDPSIKAELDAEALEVNRGNKVRPPHDSHAPLLRIKAAAGLAALENRTEITPDDWRLATQLWEHSCTVRDCLLEYGKRARSLARRKQTRAKAAETSTIGSTQEAVKRVAGVLVRRAERSPCKNQQLRDAVAGRDRRYFRMAREHALATGMLVETKGVFSGGEAEKQ